MEDSAFFTLGKRLSEFLVEKFAPAPGSRSKLGFLGTGVAVDADSFLSDGQFNPARINKWLEIVADPLGMIDCDEGRVSPAPLTASSLMQVIASVATCAAPADSEQFRTFAKARSDHALNMGGVVGVNTAPLDWYDQARLPQWPQWQQHIETGSSEGAGAPPPPLPRPPLWAWRTLDHVKLQPIAESPAQDFGQLQGKLKFESAVLRSGLATQDLRVSKIEPGVARPVLAAGGLARLGQLRMMGPEPAADEADAFKGLTLLVPAAPMAAAADLQPQGAEVSAVPIAHAAAMLVREQSVTRISAAQAMLVSSAIADAADRASTSSISASRFDMSLKYMIVSLSRAPWWADFLLLLDNWYVPGMQRGALIPAGDEQRVPGVPVAMILTSDVRVTSTWSDADRTAAASHSNFGPWSLSNFTFQAAEKAGEATLEIPGVQVVACIFSELPALPPRPDPAIVAAPVAAGAPAPAPPSVEPAAPAPAPGPATEGPPPAVPEGAPAVAEAPPAVAATPAAAPAAPPA